MDQKKEQEMGIKNLSEDVILVDLPSEASRRADELKAVNEAVGEKPNCDVIIDFSKVEIINSWNISNLLILRGLLQDSGRQLVLCNVGTLAKCIFVVAGLNEAFVFADDQPAALAAVQNKSSLTGAQSQ